MERVARSKTPPAGDATASATFRSQAHLAFDGVTPHPTGHNNKRFAEIFANREEPMRKLILVMICATLSPMSAARAQLLPPNAAGASMGHLHYFVRDMAANRKFWMAFG